MKRRTRKELFGRKGTKTSGSVICVTGDSLVTTKKCEVRVIRDSEREAQRDSKSWKNIPMQPASTIKVVRVKMAPPAIPKRCPACHNEPRTQVLEHRGWAWCEHHSCMLFGMHFDIQQWNKRPGRKS